MTLLNESESGGEKSVEAGVDFGNVEDFALDEGLLSLVGALAAHDDDLEVAVHQEVGQPLLRIVANRLEKLLVEQIQDHAVTSHLQKVAKRLLKLFELLGIWRVEEEDLARIFWWIRIKLVMHLTPRLFGRRLRRLLKVRRVLVQTQRVEGLSVLRSHSLLFGPAAHFDAACRQDEGGEEADSTDDQDVQPSAFEVTSAEGQVARDERQLVVGNVDHGCRHHAKFRQIRICFLFFRHSAMPAVVPMVTAPPP